MFEDKAGMLSVPLPFSVEVDEADPAVWPSGFKATSGQWPGLQGMGACRFDAIWELMCAVSNAQPLEHGVVEALDAADYGPDVAESWDRQVRDPRLPLLRQNPDDAVFWLNDYTSNGVPAAVACEFLAVGLSPSAAGQVHASGISPTEARPYVDCLGDFYIDNGGEQLLTAFAADDDDLVDWILSEFDPGHATFYAEACVIALEEARAWNPVVEAHGLTSQDLRDIRRVHWTPAEVNEAAAGYSEHGLTVGAAARTVLALAASAPAWEDPPF